MWQKRFLGGEAVEGARIILVGGLGPKTAVDIIHQCLLTHGYCGWSLDLPHQQRLRDVMGLEIGDGTAQIMTLMIARERTRNAIGRQAARRRAPVCPH